MRKLKLAAQFVLAYVAGLVVASIFLALKVGGFIRIEHPERIPRNRRSMLIVVNHPSLVEPFFIPTLFFREWVWSPRKWGPWSTPDRTNLQKKLMWLFWIGGARNIPVPRKLGERESRREFVASVRAAFRRIRAVLKIGGRVILFFEGGRTTSVPPHERLRSPKGNELRPLRPTVGKLIAVANPTVLPISVTYPWVRDPKKGWLPIRIKVGHPVRFDGLAPGAVVDILQKSMLALADEGGD